MSSYALCILVITVALAGVTGLRIGDFVCKKMGIDWPNTFTGFVFCVGGAVLCASIMGYICVPALAHFGYIGGLVVMAASIPAAGFIWAFPIGMTMGINRILNGLMTRLS